jgi:urease accessory protein
MAGDRGWHGRLELRYRRDGARTVAHDLHQGPLRVLRSLYPEGPAICHHVLVHPPGGMVGGDRIEVEAHWGPGSQALITTPGATRFYRCEGAAAVQTVRLRLETNARAEWLPLEAIAYPGCDAVNELRFDLAPGAELIGWDLLALGLPEADRPFADGRYAQHLEWPGHWLERATLDAGDRMLLDGALGLDGQRALATLWFAAADGWADARRDSLLDAARQLADDERTALAAGASAPQRGLVVLRALAPRIEPVQRLLRAVHAAWRRLAWGLEGETPRVWRT